MKKLLHELFRKIGEDPDREGLRKTPERIAEVYEYLTSGYKMRLSDVVGDAIFHEKSNDMILLKDIEFFSLCEHHLLPFFGKAHIAYIPRGKIVGLSKLPRIVDMYSRRLQVQERMTHQIAEAIQETIKPLGVAVVVEGVHLCLMMRGVEKQGTKIITSAVLGCFKDRPETRAEFLSLLK